MESLEQAFDDFADAVSELRNTPARSAHVVLGRLVQITEEPAMRAFLDSHLSAFDYDLWLETAKSTFHVQPGSATLDWPRKLEERVACRLAICRSSSTGDRKFVYEFCYLFTGMNGNHDDRLRDFISLVVDPLHQDLRRLAERREAPATLSLIMKRGFPPSSEAQLDRLLQEAVEKFRDNSPITRKEGVERLLDAWERLKTLIDDDKKKSMHHLLEQAADTPLMRQILEDEARALSGIGNNFNLRHHERSKTPLVRSEHLDYVFHRVAAMIQLLLATTRSDAAP